MDFYHSLEGMLRVRLVSADPAAAMSAVLRSKIEVFDATRDDEDIVTEFYIRRQDWKRLRSLCQRRGYALTFVGQKGLFWPVLGILHRPVLLFGMLILITLAMYLPSRVLFVRVEGARSVPERLILEKCQQVGISFGASRKDVRSEKMKNALLEAIPELQWAGINTAGCTATVSVRERSETADEAEEIKGVSSLVAVRDGVITQCTVIRGSAVCKVGDAVKAGQVLVSGYTDCGISIQATRAHGEIYARTDRDLQAVAPVSTAQKGRITAVTKKFSLIIGKNRINFYKGSGISDASCDKMYSVNWLTLPGGFQLPVALVTEVCTSYELQTPAAQEDATALLQDFAENYLHSQMIAGTLIRKQELLEPKDGVYVLQGKYACTEMIGKVQHEEIIKPNGE